MNILYTDQNMLDYVKHMVRAFGICTDLTQTANLFRAIKDDFIAVDAPEYLLTCNQRVITLGFWFNKNCDHAKGNRSAVFYTFDTFTGIETVSST